MLTAYTIWKSLLKHEGCLGNCNQHYSYFSKDFQMLLAVKEGA